ncbi:hypothetical protein FBU31_000797 [Coemansia sp. 'formosensis']|nr:hypothetical protein FBU31_000797 [Coemansia sp. 'formosensis']
MKQSNTPPIATKKVVEPPLRAPTVFVPDYVDFTKVQKCLEDRRSNVVTVNSTTFSGDRELEKRPFQRFFVMESDHFTLFNHYHPPVKFSYKSRNAVMSNVWRDALYTNAFGTKFVDVDGLLQLEPLPVLSFVFGKDADTLLSSYLIDDNTISEYYEATTTTDMTALATVARGKAGLCVSHCFVVNRGKEYWAVDTKDPNISYAFSPSTKTRTISKLADGSMTVQALIDEEQSQTSVEAHTNQSSNFKLHDINGEEVVEGDNIVFHIQSGRGDDEDLEERRSMFDGKDWLHVLVNTGIWDQDVSLIHGATDNGATFGVTVVDNTTYITFEGQFLQVGSKELGLNAIFLPDIPSKRDRIHISYTDDGDIALSQWGSGVPIVCSWAKYAYGAVYVHDLEDAAYTRESLRLRIVKV